MVNLQEGLCQAGSSQIAAASPSPLWWVLPTHTSTGDTPILAGSFGSVSYIITAPFLWLLVCTWFFFFCALSAWSLCFPQPCGSLIIKSFWPSRSDPVGIPTAFVRSQTMKPDVGFQTFTTVGELLWHYCSPGCRSPTQCISDMILLWLCPSGCLAVASSLTLDVGYLLW